GAGPGAVEALLRPGDCVAIEFEIVELRGARAQMYHAADRVRAPERALRAAQDLDLLDVVHVAEAERDAIDELAGGAGCRGVAADQAAQDQLPERIGAAGDGAVDVQ